MAKGGQRVRDGTVKDCGFSSAHSGSTFIGNVLKEVKTGETYLVGVVLAILKLVSISSLCIFSLGVIPTRYHKEHDASESDEEGSLREEAPSPPVLPEHQDGDIQRALTGRHPHLLAQEESGDPHGLQGGCRC
jgi:hypothetical protein